MLAVAQELRRTDPGGDVLIVGRSGGVAEGLVTEAGFRLETLDVSGLDVSRPASVARFAVQLPGSLAAARRIIRGFDADVVVGAAGYVSVPVVLAATSLRVPVVLMEQNALPGRATRLLAHRGRTVAASFVETAQHLRGARVVNTGNPIRAEVLGTPPRALGERCESLLVMGGSQGARRINRAVAGCAQGLLASHPHLHITHQTGRIDFDEIRAAADALPAATRERWNVLPFIDDVGVAIVAADLVVMRAGGSSLAECAALGRPMILVPYPHAGDHQRWNAAPFVAAGAARLVSDADCVPERLLREILAVVDDPPTWQRMVRASRELGRPGAATEVVRLLGEVAGSAARMPA